MEPPKKILRSEHTWAPRNHDDWDDFDETGYYGLNDDEVLLNLLPDNDLDGPTGSWVSLARKRGVS